MWGSMPGLWDHNLNQRQSVNPLSHQSTTGINNYYTYSHTHTHTWRTEKEKKLSSTEFKEKFLSKGFNDKIGSWKVLNYTAPSFSFIIFFHYVGCRFFLPSKLKR